jgi:DNA-binding transcriptional LysR family regulator
LIILFLPFNGERLTCLLGTRDCWWFDEAGKLRNPTVKGNLQCDSGTPLRDVALKGLGLLQLPDYSREFIETGQLVAVLNKQKQSMKGERKRAVMPGPRQSE